VYKSADNWCMFDDISSEQQRRLYWTGFELVILEAFYFNEYILSTEKSFFEPNETFP
jgi:hypothetical protein